MSILRKWTTAEITEDLAGKLRADQFLVAREATLRADTGQRADLLAMRRKLSRSPMLIFEIKTSRADFTGDLKREKWRGYLASGAVAFAIPAGLAELSEIPPEAGLIVRIAQGWSWRRAPKWADAPMPTDYLYRRMALTASDQSAARADAALRPKAASLWLAQKTARTEQGRMLAAIAADVETWRKIAEEEKEKWRRLERASARLHQEMCELEARRRVLLRECVA